MLDCLDKFVCVMLVLIAGYCVCELCFTWVFPLIAVDEPQENEDWFREDKQK